MKDLKFVGPAPTPEEMAADHKHEPIISPEVYKRVQEKLSNNASLEEQKAATKKSAEEAGVKDGDIVSIELKGDRGLVLNNVLVRAGEIHAAEVHLDTDEGNAAGCGPDAVCTILK